MTETATLTDRAREAYGRCLDMFVHAANDEADTRPLTETEALGELEKFIRANSASLAVLQAADDAAERAVREHLGMDRFDDLPDDVTLRVVFSTPAIGQFPRMAVGRVTARLHSGFVPDLFGDMTMSVVHGDWLGHILTALLDLTAQLRAGEAEASAEVASDD